MASPTSSKRQSRYLKSKSYAISYGIVVSFHRFWHTISYNGDIAYDIGMRYRIMVTGNLEIVCDVCIFTDIVCNIVYDIVYTIGKNPSKHIRYRTFFRCRIRYRMFGIRYRTFDIRYRIQNRIRYRIYDWQEPLN